jgi:predicted metal-dependent enzyme (double-stranded beta helix superfamily)
MTSLKAVMEGLSGDVAEIEQALQYVSGVGGNARQVFYRSPQLTMLKVCFPSGRRTPPHDHGTWATILLLSGQEKNTLYRREGGKLRRAGEATLERGATLTIRPDTVHVAECLSDVPAIGLHVYGGDILELPRRMWDPETLEEHALDWQLYERFAGAASRAASAPAA